MFELNYCFGLELLFNGSNLVFFLCLSSITMWSIFFSNVKFDQVCEDSFSLPAMNILTLAYGSSVIMA